ncbi:MAG: EpsG family protein [Lachnospiraceae bacterium]|nr:EpsG family protein [Lachnospiraceae bacterium]
MDFYIYFGLLFFITVIALCSFKIGNCCIDGVLTNISVLLFAIFSIYIFYTSVNAIDSVNYETKFEYINTLSVSVDYLFTAFIKFVKKFTDDYQIFRGIIGCIYLVPIFLILKREKKSDFNIPLFLMLCLIFPFFQNIVALRYTMASAIAVSAMYLYLKSNQSRKAAAGVVVAILVSSMIHDVTIIYLIIFALFLLYKRISDKTIMTFSLMGLDVVLIILLRTDVLSGLLNSLIGDTNTFYLGIMESAGIGFVISIFLHVCFVLLIQTAIQRNNNGENNIDESDYLAKSIDEDIMLLNYCSFILIPMYAVNVLSFRLFRGMLVLDFLEVSKCYNEKNKDIALFEIIILEVICMLFDANGIESIISVIGGVIACRIVCVFRRQKSGSYISKQKRKALCDHPLLWEVSAA